MVETGTFIDGFVNKDGETCRAFTLEERTFRHTLELANDRSVDKALLAEGAYYDAAVISRRLKVAGIEQLTPEMVLELQGDDADVLTNAIMVLEKRRDEFRRAQQAQSEAAASPA